MHHFIKATDVRLTPAYLERSRGFRRASLVDRSVGSVHMGLGLCALQAGGHIETHLHSFEESFFVLEGQPTLVLDGRAYPLTPGACGVVPVSVAHAWIGTGGGNGAVGGHGWRRSRAVKGRPTIRSSSDRRSIREGEPLDIRDPRSRHLFRIDERDIALEGLKTGARIDAPTVSASMSTALLAYSGIAVKMLVDQRLDAQLSTMFMVEYQPGGVAHPHDHPIEESYYVLDGEVEAVADGKTYILHEGDLFWTGVGCIHAFYNRTTRTVRWLETQSPQPPARHSYRFSRDWEYLKHKLAGAAAEPEPRAVAGKTGG